MSQLFNVPKEEGQVLWDEPVLLLREAGLGVPCVRAWQNEGVLCCVWVCAHISKRRLTGHSRIENLEARLAAYENSAQAQEHSTQFAEKP